MKNNLAAILLTSLAAVCATAYAGNFVVFVLDKKGKPVPDAEVVFPANKLAQPKVTLPMLATISPLELQFTPAVTLVNTDARVTSVNNDPWDHHVR